MSEYSFHLPPRSEIIRSNDTPTPSQKEQAQEDAHNIAKAFDELAGSGEHPGVLEQLRKDPQLKDDPHFANDFLQALSHVKDALHQVENDKNARKITEGQSRELIGDDHFAGLTGPFTSLSEASVNGHRLRDIMENSGPQDAAKEYLSGLFQSETTPTAWFTKVKMPDIKDMMENLKNYKG